MTVPQPLVTVPASRGHISIYRETATYVAHSPAAWLFGVLYIVAVVSLAATGHTIDLLTCLEPLFFLLLTFLVIVPLTAGAPPTAWEEPLPYPRRRLWWQVLVVVLYAIMMTFGVQLGELLHFPFFLSLLSILKIIVPVGAALLLGARWRELGLGWGYHSWWSALVLSAPLVIALVVLLALRVVLPLRVLEDFIQSFVLAGLGEELMFRGVLMTRLVRLLGRDWGIVIAALFFGIGHTFANTGYFNHASLLLAFALSIPFQAAYGLVLALVLQRTRNLVAGIALHTWTDTLNFAILPLILRFLH